MFSGLGGTAGVTSRGTQSITSFVQEGKQEAHVDIVLDNNCDNSFRPEEFGDKIKITRIIRRTGTPTSRYIIKNSTGHVVSRERKHLQEICDHFQIQVRLLR